MKTKIIFLLFSVVLISFNSRSQNVGNNAGKASIRLTGLMTIDVAANDLEGTTLTKLESKKINDSEIFVVGYRVDPGKNTTVTLPEVEIKIEFPLFDVVRLMMPYDFGACSRIGMHYSSELHTHASGYEPFTLFVGADGQCKYLVGLANLEYSSWMRSHVYGGPAEEIISGVKGIGAVEIKRNSAKLNHFKGSAPRVFEDAVYIDSSGGDPYDAVKRYLTWLRENYYPGSPNIPKGQDEVLWHSWYAHQCVINQDIISAQAEIAGELGIRRIQIDAYWDVPPKCGVLWGSNIPDPERFSDFPTLAGQLHERGQRLAVHVNPFLINPDVFKEQEPLMPALITQHATPLALHEQQYILCPRSAQTRDYVMSWIKRMVGEYGVDEIWYDFVDDYSPLFGDCDSPLHHHVDGTPGENVISILRDADAEIRRINPNACLWGRRQETNAITRQWEPTLTPHDRYLDYLGNLRECIFLHQLSHQQLVEFMCTNWPAGEDPAVVARHMICGIFAGVPAISVDLTKQSQEVLDVIKTYVTLYRQNKHWSNEVTRRLLCPVDPIRAIALDGPGCSWILLTAPAPGLIEIPKETKEIRIFSTAMKEIGTVLSVQGHWKAVLQDHLLNEVKEVPLEQLHGGIFLRTNGNPLFCVHLKKMD